MAVKLIKYLKKINEKKDVCSAATGSILDTVTATSTCSNSITNPQSQKTNEKIKSNDTNMKPIKCSICSFDGKLGNQNKEVYFVKSINESKYNPPKSHFQSMLPPPLQTSNNLHVNKICE